LGSGVERLRTGVKGFDELVEGGIPRGFFVAVVGEPGTGKTIFCLHFVAAGLSEGDKAVYVTTEESKESVVRQAMQFGMDFQSAVERGKLIIIDALMRDRESEWSLADLSPEELIEKILEAKRRLGYGRARLVVDSMSAFWLDKPAMARRISYNVKRVLSKWDFTALLVSQYAVTSDLAFGFGLEHVADGIVRFKKLLVRGQLRRYVIVEKMRQTNHDLRAHLVEIKPGVGMVVAEPSSYRAESFRLPREVVEEMQKAKERSREGLTEEPEWPSE